MTRKQHHDVEISWEAQGLKPSECELVSFDLSSLSTLQSMVAIDAYAQYVELLRFQWLRKGLRALLSLRSVMTLSLGTALDILQNGAKLYRIL